MRTTIEIDSSKETTIELLCSCGENFRYAMGDPKMKSEALRWAGAHAACDTVICETCGHSTMMDSTKRCDDCWELEHRLADYLRRGGDKARAFVAEKLGEAGWLEEVSKLKDVIERMNPKE